MGNDRPSVSNNVQLEDVVSFLGQRFPLDLAEEWDNVGLLVGDPQRSVRQIMTCLTITPVTAAEAITKRADLIVTHHPLPFRPLKTLTTTTTAGKLLWQLIGAQIAIYSSHTAFDSADDGINSQLARALGLTQVLPLILKGDSNILKIGLGAGRMGDITATPLTKIAEQLKQFLHLTEIRAIGDTGRVIRRIGIGCGSGGSFLETALRAGCDLFVTGEMTFHQILEVEAQGIHALLLGHYASERFAMENLAEEIAAKFDGIRVWASHDECNPLRPL